MITNYEVQSIKGVNTDNTKKEFAIRPSARPPLQRQTHQSDRTNTSTGSAYEENFFKRRRENKKCLVPVINNQILHHYVLEHSGNQVTYKCFVYKATIKKLRLP